METFRQILLYVCGSAFFASAAVLLAVKFFVPMWEKVRSIAKLSRVEQFVVGLLIVGLIQYGSTKVITFDGGIKDGAQRSHATNDTVTITWQRDTRHGVYVPETATVYIDYRLSVDTNGEWNLLAETTVGQWGWTGTLADSTNYDYNVWAYYIPPEPVHTNGVWVYKTLKDRKNENPIPLRARIEINGKAIATPKEVRKDEND